LNYFQDEKSKVYINADRSNTNRKIAAAAVVIRTTITTMLKEIMIAN
jgi:hypothetical protein